MPYGDLNTIKAIHRTKSHMAKELHDTDSLNHLYLHTLKIQFKSAEAKKA